jgi:hypothetical protein
MATKEEIRDAQRREDKARHTYRKQQARIEKRAALRLPPSEVLERSRDRWRSRLSAAKKASDRLERVPRKEVPRVVDHRLGNNSSRGGATIRLIVLHITVSQDVRGISDIVSLQKYGSTPSSGVSWHRCNDREGNVGILVPDHLKAWTCAAYNPVSLNLEQIEDDILTRAQWLAKPKQLESTAHIVAFWSVRHRIPLEHSTKRGVCQHRELGKAGGGHQDCAPHYPLDKVLGRAKTLRGLYLP